MPGFLSQTAEYALRAAAWMASQPPGLHVRARDMSEGTGIPVYYLSKILRRLVVGGVLTSQKGQGGGFALARPADEIAFRDVLAAVDAFGEQERCAFGWGECDVSHPCLLHEPFSRIGDAFRDWATTTTIAEAGGTAGPGSRRPRGE